MKKRRAVTYITIAQSIFLTIKYFVQNRLFSYASACSFDFLFSFIPIAMMIVTILVRILHASPDTVYSIFNKFPELSDYINSSTHFTLKKIKMESTMLSKITD